ncbi:MAG: hypothetical protein H0X26_09705 [Alphaproteobacteria bacterium]|nr:hypothetical protein [Alphaproteobacteria bacterium]
MKYYKRLFLPHLSSTCRLDKRKLLNVAQKLSHNLAKSRSKIYLSKGDKRNGTSYIFLLSLSLCLTGCMGIYEGGFECPAGVGVGCKSISDVNTMINRNLLPGVKNQAMEENTVSYDERSPDSHLLTPESPEIWYAPSMRGQQKTTACPATIDAKYRSETQPVFKVEHVL